MTVAGHSTEVAVRGSRVRVIDVARALVIIGVVFNHSVDGLVTYGMVDPHSGLDVVNRALYLLRVPALAFFLGLFMPGSIEKRGRAEYVAERASFMLYLYVVWFYVEGLSELATNGFKNRQFSAFSLTQPWITFAHLWFLPFVVVATVLITAARPWMSWTRGWVVGTVALASSVLLWGWNSSVFGLRGLALIFFVLAGSVVGTARLAAWLRRSAAGWAAAGSISVAGLVAGVAWGAVPATLSSDVTPVQATVSLVSALCGTVALCALAVYLSKVAAVARLLSAIGRRTLPIYLAHVILVAGVRVGALEFGVDNAYLIVACAIVVGVAFPLFFHRYLTRCRWSSWIFEMPDPARRTVTRGVRRFQNRTAAMEGCPDRILHVVNRIGVQGDGISNVCVDLACQQSISGDDVTIATTLGGYTELVQRSGVKVTEIDFRSQTLGGALAALIALRRLLREIRPEIVHAHTVVATVIARVAVVGMRAKVVATVHNEYQRGVVLMAFAHRIIGVSGAVSDAMCRRGVPSRKVRTVLNGVVGSVRRPHGDPPVPAILAKPAILAVGAVSHRKGADVLVEVAAQLAASHGAHTYFAGNIDWAEPQRAAQGAAAENIHFLGFQSDPRGLLASATVFVLASRQDPAPLVLVEAMEAALPIVASAVDGVPELLDGGAAGVLVPPDDPTALTAAVRGLLDDDEVRAQFATAAGRSSGRLGVARVCSDYRDVYADLTGRTSVRPFPALVPGR
jgi:glycosyltransferase involved in cell wall biosynthesis